MAGVGPITRFERAYDPEVRGVRLVFSVDLVALGLTGLVSTCILGLLRRVRQVTV